MMNGSMKGLGNKKILARNLKRYVDESGKLGKEIAAKIGVAPATFSEWLNEKKYPRIDKIELLANYFHIQKSDLIENQDNPDEALEEPIQAQVKNIRTLAHVYPDMPPEMQKTVDYFLEGLFQKFDDQFKKGSNEE